MASFADALLALAQGRLKADVLLTHMERTLAQRPELLDGLITQLSEAYAHGQIEASTFAKLKAHAMRAVQLASAEDPAVPSHANADAAAPAASTSTPAGVSGTGMEEFEIDLDHIELGATRPPGVDGGARPFAVGAVVKERFVLEEILGVGGMGTVYKARDLVKVEARDRNPFVALKVLNENFKKHRNAFIALQREASRQQKLAHPNIATVHDFDRSGDNVYLTMEYLEGQALNSYLRREVRARGGLPFEQAWPMIRGLGQALAYAHERDIVHSDFKPANCFLTVSGTVKVLDFGIARVVKNQEELEKTLYDPTSLGALTPAYASPEMLMGEEPDPRDDVYALACVAYELLAGRHPFDRKSATIAIERKMTPAPVRRLARSRMRALSRALALTRAERSPSVNEFLAAMEGKRGWMSGWW